MLRWRADLLAALRARLLLLAAWTCLVALAAAGAIAGEWWRPVASGDIVVASEADGQEYLRDFSEERDLSAPALAPTGGDGDLATLVSDWTHCGAGVGEVRAVSTGGSPFVLRALDARHSDRLDTGVDQRPAASGRRFVEVVVTARNTGDVADHPWFMFSLVTGDGKVYADEVADIPDRPGVVEPGNDAAGVLVFQLPAEYPNTGGRMVIVAGPGVRTPDGALEAVARGDCGRINPATTRVVGDSPRVMDGRLIGPGRVS